MHNINSFAELLEISHNKRFYEVFLGLESQMLEKKPEELKFLMRKHLNDMRNAIQNGLSSHQLSVSGMSGQDSIKIADRYKDNKNLPMNSLFGKILSYSIAVMEENQRMGKIIACPTAGSCGIVPAIITGYAEEMNFSEDEQVNALITAGGIGKIVAQQVALAGAVAGCQAECGVASAMAAGAIVQMMNGSNEQIINAAALSLKNLLGLACDPVAGLVEVPCIKRNGFLAIHAVTGSEMALAGIQSVIPMDEVVQAMKQIGYLMSPVLKESSEGGLAITPTAREITEKLHKIWRD